jgi:cell fate regulator YaaT (PSP1 superfamily)
MTNTIVGIRFQEVSKIYHFKADHVEDIQTGDYAVVETSRGQQLGQVVELLDETDLKQKGYLKPITRVATPRDLVLRQVWEYKEKEAVEACRTKVNELNIKGVKIVSAEYTFDGKRLTLMYNTDGDDKVDLSRLMDALKSLFRRTRVEMRQVGPRDMAKIVGGMGVCGMGIRCCSMFLTEFEPISIRMAKNQGVSLAPTEITGMCGRLRCCLGYENDTYVEARKELPREKQHIDTPAGEAIVIGISPLVKTVTVSLEDGGTKEFTLGELNGETNTSLEDNAVVESMERKEGKPNFQTEQQKGVNRRRSKRKSSRRRKKRR